MISDRIVANCQVASLPCCCLTPAVLVCVTRPTAMLPRRVASHLLFSWSDRIVVITLHLWQTHRTHQPNTLTDGLASHLLMCCVVVSSPSTPVNMGRCCRVASHLLCLCCPTPALPVRHTAACGCVIDCHVASHTPAFLLLLRALPHTSHLLCL